MEVFVVDNADSGKRLDLFLSGVLVDRSRSYLQQIIKEGYVKINGQKVKRSGIKLTGGDKVSVCYPSKVELKLKPLELKLDVIFEDNDLLVLNKPAGLVVHPGVNNTHIEDSLVNAILHHCAGRLSGINGVLRPGIVHRLDRDTSGVMVVAKSDTGHRYLAEQFKNHTVDKLYIALVAGHIYPQKGTIDAPIARDPRDRKRMAVRADGKQAITKYKVIEYLGNYSLLEVKILTGRTHQIRTHFSSIGFPLVGDPVYGRPRVNNKFRQDYGLKRVFLHSKTLTIRVPSGTRTSFEADLPEDLAIVLNLLRDSTTKNSAQLR